eukprot:480315_1
MLQHMPQKHGIEKYVTCTICNSLKPTSQFSYNQLETNKNKCKACVVTLRTPPKPLKCYTCNIIKDKEYFSSKQLRKRKLKKCKSCISSATNKKKILFTDYSIIKTFDYKWKIYSTPNRSILLCNGYIRTQFTSKSNIPKCCISNICCNYFEPQTPFNQIHNAPVATSKCSKIFVLNNFKWMACFSPKKYSKYQTNCILSFHSLMYLNSPWLSNTNITVDVVFSLFDNDKLIGHHKSKDVFRVNGRKHFPLSIPMYMLQTLNEVEFGINIVLKNQEKIPNYVQDKSFFSDKFSLCLPSDKNQFANHESDLFEMISCKWYLQFSLFRISWDGLCLELYKADASLYRCIGTISILYELILEPGNTNHVYAGHVFFKKTDKFRTLDFCHDWSKVKSKILHVKFTIIEICDKRGMAVQYVNQYSPIKFIKYPTATIWKPLLSTADFGIIKAFIKSITTHQNDIELQTIAEICYQYFVGLKSRQDKI